MSVGVTVVVASREDAQPILFPPPEYVPENEV